MPVLGRYSLCEALVLLQSKMWKYQYTVPVFSVAAHFNHLLNQKNIEKVPGIIIPDCFQAHLLFPSTPLMSSMEHFIWFLCFIVFLFFTEVKTLIQKSIGVG